MNIGELLLFHLLAFVSADDSVSCPGFCECSQPVRTVKCANNNYLTYIPQNIPSYVRTLFITGNNITRLESNAFSEMYLEQLISLNLSGNGIEIIEPLSFVNLPNLKYLDLSNNRILNFSVNAFNGTNSLTNLTLSNALFNYSFMNELEHLFQYGSLSNLETLALPSNNLLYLTPGMFSALPKLKHLDLRNNTLLKFHKDTFAKLSLEFLDLSDNSLKNVKNETLTQLNSQSDLSIGLDNNMWTCDCEIESFLIWLNHSNKVKNKEHLTCYSPDALRDIPLLQVKLISLECVSPNVLQTSYVFLGIVLALIGAIFLLVLYLNRKGIKKWMHNIRDACRDHMEGYHYRYEINTDPRLTNLSTNSDI